MIYLAWLVFAVGCVAALLFGISIMRSQRFRCLRDGHRWKPWVRIDDWLMRRECESCGREKWRRPW